MQCVSITINSDSRDEPDKECLLFAISNSVTEGLVLGNTVATICIDDDDGKVVSWQLMSYTFYSH